MARLLIFFFITTATMVWAQPSTTIGVILSGTGSASDTGTIQLAAAQGAMSSWDVVIRNDQSDPERAAELARNLVRDGASALICCTTQEATEKVATFARDEQVVLFALNRVPVNPWVVQLVPSIDDQLTGLINELVTHGKTRAGMLATDTPANRALGELFSQLGALGALQIIDPVFVSATETEFRPDMLWLASRELDALVFLGSQSMLNMAIAAGEQRGFSGDIYVPGSALGQQFSTPVSMMLRPSTTEPTSLYGYQVALYNSLFQETIDWLDYSANAAFGVPIPIDTPQMWRQLLRDSLISLPPFAGARLQYDAHDNGRTAVTPQSLKAYQIIGTRLQEGTPGLR